MKCIKYKYRKDSTKRCNNAFINKTTIKSCKKPWRLNKFQYTDKSASARFSYFVGIPGISENTLFNDSGLGMPFSMWYRWYR